MEPEQQITIIDGSRFIKKVNANTGEISYREFKGKISQELLDQLAENKISVNNKINKINKMEKMEKKPRAPTAYNLFFKEHYEMTSGTPQERMKQIAEMYKRSKAGKTLTKKPITKKVVGNITKKKPAVDPLKEMFEDQANLRKQLANAPKLYEKKKPQPGDIPKSFLEGLSPELVKKIRKMYNPDKEYSLADEFAELSSN